MSTKHNKSVVKNLYINNQPKPLGSGHFLHFIETSRNHSQPVPCAEFPRNYVKINYLASH